MHQSPEGIYLGTSGWSYPEWNSIVYPEKFPRNKMLRYYAEIFHTAEINSTFYQIPSIKVAESWARNSPEFFKYSAKFPDLITHKAKLDLNKSINPLNLFLDNISPLIMEEKLLALLLQLPPSFGNAENEDFKKLKNFLIYWNSTILDKFQNSGLIPPQIVVEFRNKYWMQDDSFLLLKENDASYCVVVEPLLPPKLEITDNNMFYIRFHGFGKKPRPWFDYNFNDDQLKEWAQKLKPIIDKVRSKDGTLKKAVLYFNNHFSGYAVKNSLSLAKKLDLPVKNSIENLTKPLNFVIGNKKPKPKQPQIDDFF